MDQDLENRTGANRRERLVEQLDRMVKSGRATEQEAGRLRAARGPDEFDDVVRDIRVRHARTRLDAAIKDGDLSQAEADGLFERLSKGEHPRAVRADLVKIRRRLRSRVPGSGALQDHGQEDFTA
jgi:hypothetical protein